uniref:Uncharacterized protein LOC111111385 n=1 Tax=Crassostrea virginica TaxID=6565 RepID=A0A8B8BL34_CRAVI|nr:uncharacterized protein LOC111111385 [Crassostrea virginica]
MGHLPSWIHPPSSLGLELWYTTLCSPVLHSKWRDSECPVSSTGATYPQRQHPVPHSMTSLTTTLPDHSKYHKPSSRDATAETDLKSREFGGAGHPMMTGRKSSSGLILIWTSCTLDGGVPNQTWAH